MPVLFPSANIAEPQQCTFYSHPMDSYKYKLMYILITRINSPEHTYSTSPNSFGNHSCGCVILSGGK